ncbi:MAG: GNAT family N-acetyltransferase [Bacteroidales bacterium]|nr:GNAT family N-acetyltransferase [Bacteroidales bacterium]
MISTSIPGFYLKHAEEKDVLIILDLIKGIAAYEKLSHEVVATEELLKKNLFGQNRYAEVVIGYEKETPVGFALFFHNFSTFTGRPGLYLEDLFVFEEYRGKGYGKALLLYLARIAGERDCGRFEWVVLDWNKPAIDFYNSLGAKQMKEWIITRIDGEGIERLAEMF